MLLMKLMPWEQARAIRSLNQRASYDLEAIETAERQAAQGNAVLLSSAPRPWQEQSLRTWPYHYPVDFADKVQKLFDIETRRRAVRLQLAAEAFKAEHGQLPETLDELVGTYLDRMQVDPQSGLSFSYFSKGLPAPIRTTGGMELMPAGAPFLCSPYGQVSGPEGHRLDILQDELRDSKVPFFQWHWGELFPVP